MSELITKGQKAKAASYELMNAGTVKKNEALELMAQKLIAYKEEIIKENKKDLERAMEKGTSKAMLDRLSLDEARIEGMANGLRKVAALDDPESSSWGYWNYI